MLELASSSRLGPSARQAVAPTASVADEAHPWSIGGLAGHVVGKVLGNVRELPQSGSALEGGRRAVFIGLRLDTAMAITRYALLGLLPRPEAVEARPEGHLGNRQSAIGERAGFEQGRSWNTYGWSRAVVIELEATTGVAARDRLTAVCHDALDEELLVGRPDSRKVSE